MKILRNADKETTKFKTLDVGDTFLYKGDPTVYDAVYIKVAEVKDKHHLNAVRLRDGSLDYFKDEDNVTIVEGTWVEDGIELLKEDNEDDE